VDNHQVTARFWLLHGAEAPITNDLHLGGTEYHSLAASIDLDYNGPQAAQQRTPHRSGWDGPVAWGNALYPGSLGVVCVSFVYDTI
jgi:hypothetical protein